MHHQAGIPGWRCWSHHLESHLNHLVHCCHVSWHNGGSHSLIASNVRDSVNGLSWHGKWSPSVSGDLSPRCQGHEPLSSLSVSGWPQAYWSERLVCHVIAVFLRPGLIEGECVENILHNGRCCADVTAQMHHSVLTIPLGSPRSPFSISPQC